MGDSDEEYDRRGRGRDKFRRERNDYNDRNSGNRNDDWNERDSEEVAEEDVPEEVTEEDVPEEVTEEDVPEEVTEEDVDQEVTEEEVDEELSHSEAAINAEEEEEDMEEQENVEEGSLRRSHRQRFPVQECWRGQRLIYGRDNSVVGSSEGTEYVVVTKRDTSTKRKFATDLKNKSEINIFELSIHNKKFKSNENNENKNSLNIKSLNDLIWKESNQSKGVDISIVNKNKSKGDAIGMLRLKGMAEKKKSKTGGYTTHLSVTLGVLSLKIDDNEEVVIRTGDSFTVRSNTSYSLVNLRKDNAYVSFTVLKD